MVCQCQFKIIDGESDNFQGEGATEAIRNRIVTGDWAAGKRRAGATGGDSEGEGGGSGDDDVGDFEDVETGEKFSTLLGVFCCCWLRVPLISRV